MPTRLHRTVITAFTLVFFVTSLVGNFPALADEAASPPGYKVKNQEAVFNICYIGVSFGYGHSQYTTSCIKASNNLWICEIADVDHLETAFFCCYIGILS